MLTEFFVDCFFGLASGVFSLLPDITWSVDTGAWEYIRDILDMIGYLLPMGTVGFIIATLFTLACIRIAIAFIRTLLGLFPCF